MINKHMLNKLREIFNVPYEELWNKVYSVHHAYDPRRAETLRKEWDKYLMQYDLRIMNDYEEVVEIINFHNAEVIDGVVFSDPHVERLILMGRDLAEKILAFGLPYDADKVAEYSQA